MTELEEKTERLAHMLVENDLDAVIINAQHNFAWITGGGSNGVDLSRENGIASIIVTRDGDRFILANVIEVERLLAEEVPEDGFYPIDFNWQGEKANPESVLEKARFVLETNARVATDIPMFSGIPAIEGKLAALRYRLTRDEIGRYRSLGSDAGAAVRKVIDNIAKGESEIEIAEKLRHELAANGMTSVVTLVAADERISQYRHPVPTANRGNKTLLLVTCAKRGGLIASLSRMVTLGEPSDELKMKTEAAAYVNACLLNATRPGVTGAELYQVAANAYAEKGFPGEINRHHQGGAAGYRTRDWVAHPTSGEIVQENQAFAWNPSITGTKVEETCIVTDSGTEVITATAGVPTVTTIIDGKEYHSPGVISL